MLLYYTTQDSFETVVNRRQNKPAELVGKPLKRREGGREGGREGRREGGREGGRIYSELFFIFYSQIC